MKPFIDALRRIMHMYVTDRMFTAGSCSVNSNKCLNLLVLYMVEFSSRVPYNNIHWHGFFRSIKLGGSECGKFVPIGK